MVNSQITVGFAKKIWQEKEVLSKREIVIITNSTENYKLEILPNIHETYIKIDDKNVKIKHFGEKTFQGGAPPPSSQIGLNKTTLHIYS